MTFLAIRSIPLSRRTTQAIRDAGGAFLRRERTPAEAAQIIESRDFEFVWNMGNSRMVLPDMTTPMFNSPELINILKSPQVTRGHLGSYMAPQTGETEYVWEKNPGRGGRGKYKHRTEEVDLSRLRYWEDHVEGQEYRVLTVNDRIVQQFQRTGDNNARIYTWLPVLELPEGTKDVIRGAIAGLPNSGGTIIGWDISARSEPTVVDSEYEQRQPIIYEGNTSPGLSLATARRVLEYIRTRNLTRR